METVLMSRPRDILALATLAMRPVAVPAWSFLLTAIGGLRARLERQVAVALALARRADGRLMHLEAAR